MSYPDTLAKLQGQVRQLEESRMQEARERDRLRAEVQRLRAALKDIQTRAVGDPPRHTWYYDRAEEALAALSHS